MPKTEHYEGEVEYELCKCGKKHQKVVWKIETAECSLKGFFVGHIREGCEADFAKEFSRKFTLREKSLTKRNKRVFG